MLEVFFKVKCPFLLAITFSLQDQLFWIYTKAKEPDKLLSAYSVLSEPHSQSFLLPSPLCRMLCPIYQSPLTAFLLHMKCIHKHPFFPFICVAAALSLGCCEWGKAAGYFLVRCVRSPQWRDIPGPGASVRQVWAGFDLDMSL